jgi:hypothetical protein
MHRTRDAALTFIVVAILLVIVIFDDDEYAEGRLIVFRTEVARNVIFS